MKQQFLMMAMGALFLASTAVQATTPDDAGTVAAGLKYNGVLAATAQLKVKAGREEEFKAMLPGLRATISTEDGNILIAFVQSLEDPTVFLGYGEWGSKTAFVDHLSNPGIQGFLEKEKELLAAPPTISFYKKVK